LLQRLYDLELSYDELHVPFAPNDGGADTLDIALARDDRPRNGFANALWATMEIRDDGGGSLVRLLEGRAFTELPSGSSLKALFERRIIDAIRSGSANTIFAEPWIVGPAADSYAPRILAPRSLTVSRAEVTISIAAPGHVALFELTPHHQWHLIYPVDEAGSARLDSGTHTLRTRCAAETRRDTLPRRSLVGVCDITRPLTTDMRRTRDSIVDVAGCRPDAPHYERMGLDGSGTLLLMVGDRPLRREMLEEGIAGYCGLGIIGLEHNELGAQIMRRAKGKKWAAVERSLRR
jgi:hypothetical protein